MVANENGSLLFAILLALSFPGLLVYGQEEICTLSGGTMNENGECIVCLSALNCCVLNLQTFALACDPFCVGTGGGGGREDLACGTASCQGTPSGTPCSATIQIPSDGGSLSALAIDWTCGQAGACSCDGATWNGEACADCVGAAGGYDCSNVEGGMCHDAGSCAEEGGATSAPTISPRQELERPYRSDAAFRADVERLSLPAAAEAAGVPVGGAVPNDEEGIDAMGMLKKYVPSRYNMVVSENAMKWNKLLKDDTVLGDYDFSEADAVVDYASSIGAVVRGHVLIWGRNKGVTYPEPVATEVEASSNPEATLLEIMKDHIEAVGQHFGDKIDVWDTVNEHLTSRIDDNIFFTTFGDEYVKHAFLLAREVLPISTRLVWNEALAEFGLENELISFWLEMLRQYKDENVPIDGIGIQGHSLSKLHDVDALGTLLQVVADMGFDVELTEVDVPITLFLEEEDPFAAQGEYLKRYVSACLNTGRCRGVTFWGLDDSVTWYDFVFPLDKPNLPLLIDEEGFEKPAWLGVRESFEMYAASDSSVPPTPTGETTMAPTRSPIVDSTPMPSKAFVDTPSLFFYMYALFLPFFIGSAFM